MAGDADFGCGPAVPRRYNLRNLRQTVLRYIKSTFFLMHRTSLEGAVALQLPACRQPLQQPCDCNPESSHARLGTLLLYFVAETLAGQRELEEC